MNTCGTFNVIRQAVGLIGKNEPDSDNQVSQTAHMRKTYSPLTARCGDQHGLSGGI